MSEHIKYRAWDKENNKMYYNAQHCIDLGFWISFGDILKMDRFVVMQYTTLKDKNGKEIYTGDFLKGIDGRIDKVEFDKANAMFVVLPIKSNDTQKWSLWMFNEQCEVAGNEYEDPNILT